MGADSITRLDGTSSASTHTPFAPGALTARRHSGRPRLAPILRELRTATLVRERCVKMP
jgi:hypothetical protein